MDSWMAALLILGVCVVVLRASAWLTRHLSERLGNRMAVRLIHDVELGRQVPEGIKRQRDSSMALRFDAERFAIVDHTAADGKTLQIPWADVVALTAFKQDLITVDSVVLVVRLANGTELPFSDDLEGWPELAQSLDKHLPGCQPFHEWFMAVAFPAFETNLMEIYVRDGAPVAAAST